MSRTPMRVLHLVIAALVAAALVSPAAGAGKGPSSKGGKKPIGTVASFDAATGALVVDLNDGTQFEGIADENTKVKLDHRGKPKKKGNPTTGSLEDLVPGYKVLRIKSAASDAGTVVEKIKVRKVSSDAPQQECTDADGDGFDDASGVACQGQAPEEDGDASGDS